jgi:hypothetical protein
MLYCKIVILCRKVRFAFQNECLVICALADTYKKKTNIYEEFRKKYIEDGTCCLLRKKIYLTFCVHLPPLPPINLAVKDKDSVQVTLSTTSFVRK